ncbi:MAG: 3'-5' exonuclease, partial [Acidimicrobiia bacterium]
AVIANNAARKPKHLWTEQVGGELITRYQAEDEHDEAAYVAHEIQRLVNNEGERFSDIAVFYRTNAQSRVVEEAFVHAGVPYRVVGGLKFYDRREVKDALAYLRALTNPDDEVSWRRIANTPKRGVGDTSVAKIEAYARREGITFRDGLREAPAAGVTGKALGGVRELLDVIDALERRAADQQDPAGVAALLEEMIEATGYVAELEREHTIEAQGRIENLAELVGQAREFDRALEDGTLGALGVIAGIGVGDDGEELDAPVVVPTGIARVSAYLEAISLVTDLDDDGEATDSLVTLMTMHTAKGLEFPSVFIVGMEDGIFPHVRSLGDPKELEEERRLCYVGITRAQERLYLLHAWSRTLFGSTDYYPPSRFLGEIPEELVHVVGEQRHGGGMHAHRDAVVSAATRRGPSAPANAATLPPQGARGAESAGLRVGDDVAHEVFGEGVIVDIEGRGDKAEAVIRFRDVGEKRLLLAWAPLTKL